MKTVSKNLKERIKRITHPSGEREREKRRRSGPESGSLTRVWPVDPRRASHPGETRMTTEPGTSKRPSSPGARYTKAENMGLTAEGRDPASSSAGVNTGDKSREEGWRAGRTRASGRT